MLLENMRWIYLSIWAIPPRRRNLPWRQDSALRLWRRLWGSHILSGRISFCTGQSRQIRSALLFFMVRPEQARRRWRRWSPIRQALNLRRSTRQLQARRIWRRLSARQKKRLLCMENARYYLLMRSTALTKASRIIYCRLWKMGLFYLSAPRQRIHILKWMGRWSRGRLSLN